jgi:alpha-beta hydrolase superfamily lysophospholipase
MWSERALLKRVFSVVLKTIALAALLAFTALLAWAFQSRSMPALQIWHTALLNSEFTARDATPQSTLQDYLDQEARLFDELQDKVYRRVEPTDVLSYSRYRAGGTQDPAWPQRNWNRTFELVPKDIKGGALLLHGLTDSPYSLRRIGELLYAKGFYVIGLRLPGHGTIPGALTQVRWEDWVAASRIGARQVGERIGPAQPFVIAGYSNGGGLAIKYALDALTDAALPVPDRLLLFSPEVGIEPLARIANSHKLLSFLPYFAQFKWLSIEPEYDPFKYNSFPKNAAQEAWEVTAALQRQIQEAHDAGHFEDFPGVTTFLSWADATVKTSATVQRLYGRLDNVGSELVIFDVNRLHRLTPFIPAATESPLAQLEASTGLPYRLTVISNKADSDSAQVEERSRAPHASAIELSPLQMEWPVGVYSLAHVAIPFAPNDPVYGTGDHPQGAYRGLPLGALQPRGETHLLTVPLGNLMRLRHNPFITYLEQRIIEDIDRLLPRDGNEAL